MLVKPRDAKQGKDQQETDRAGENKRTHTTLRCCVSRVAGKARKTAVYAPIHLDSRCSKALLGGKLRAGLHIESAYFNGLCSRLSVTAHPISGR
jgi:hypothetical protein